MVRTRIRTKALPRRSAGAALLALSGCAGFLGRDLARDPFPEERAEVERALRDLLDAAARKEIDRVEAFHLYGPKFSKFDDWPPLERQDAEVARRVERAALASPQAFRPSVEDLKIDVFGRVAVAAFVLAYELQAEEAKTLVRARATVVFLRDRGRWKVAHEHFSAYRPNEAASGLGAGG